MSAEAVQRVLQPIRAGRHRAMMVVTLVADAPVSLEVLWESGHAPRLSRAQLVQYRKNRNTALVRMGLSAAVIDVDADGSASVQEVRP